MGDTKLVERSALKAATGEPTKLKFGASEGDRYEVTIIEAGDGSSGHYGLEMLTRDSAAAFPEGTRMRANHDGLCEAGGDIRRVIARTIDTPWIEGNKVKTNILVSEQWSSYVREFGDIIGLSISAGGEFEDVPEGWHADGPDLVRYAEDGEEVGRRKRDVIRLSSAEESPYNSIDFVEAPGAKGRIDIALESARSHLPDLNVREQAAFTGLPFDRALVEAHTTSGQPGGTEEDIEVDEQKLAEMLAASEARTAESVRSIVAEASKPAEAPVVKPTLERTAEAVVTSGLTEGGRKAVYAAVEAGVDLDKAIESEQAREKAMRDEITKSLEADVQHGFVVGEGAALDADEFSSPAAVLERLGR